MLATALVLCSCSVQPPPHFAPVHACNTLLYSDVGWGGGRDGHGRPTFFPKKFHDSMIVSDIELTSLRGGGEGGWPPHFEIRSYVPAIV